MKELRVKFLFKGINYISGALILTVVEVDERGRMTVPKEIGLRKAKAAVIPAGSFFVVIPLIGDPYKYAGGWLSATSEVKKLKKNAEKRAAEDAVSRAKRRKQL